MSSYLEKHSYFANPVFLSENRLDDKICRSNVRYFYFRDSECVARKGGIVEKLSRKRWVEFFLLGVVGILALTGCQPAPMSTATVESVDSIVFEEKVVEQVYPDLQDESVAVEDVQSITEEEEIGSQVTYPAPEVSAPQQAEEVQPSTDAYPAPEKEIPRLKTELEATDPSAVSLASGEIQLVEFFAFW
jgi:hypothetical protein